MPPFLKPFTFSLSFSGAKHIVEKINNLPVSFIFLRKSRQ